MPVIVYKTLDLHVLYVQARRILCEFCREPFTYVLGDRKTFNVTGVPIVSSDDGMRKEAMKKAAAGLTKVARSKNAGQALCPHCKRYQTWMVSQSRMTAMGGADSSVESCSRACSPSLPESGSSGAPKRCSS